MTAHAFDAVPAWTPAGRTSPMPTAQRLRGVASSPVRDLLALADRPDIISLAGGLPAPELFDVDGLRAAYDAVLSGPGAAHALQYGPSEGDRDLRALVAARMTQRGLATTAGEVLVTTGSQQALTLVATALLDPGAEVAVTEPTYLAALQCFSLAGARLLTVTSDAHGVVPEDLDRVLAGADVRLLYLVPTFDNPTGTTLGAQRRAAVAEIAARRRVWIVEDDPYGELRYRGEAIAPLAAQPAIAEQTIHLGSFSKVGAPGLRLGWLRAPAALKAPLVVAKQAADLHTSTIDQAAAAVWWAGTDFEAHLGRLRTVYGERRDALLAALADHLPAGASWSEPDGGMFSWVRLPGTDTAALLAAALTHGVAFVPGATFYAGPPEPATLRLSFTTHPPERLAEGVRRLAEALAA